jgi:hypothetical protein
MSNELVLAPPTLKAGKASPPPSPLPRRCSGTWCSTRSRPSLPAQLRQGAGPPVRLLCPPASFPGAADGVVGGHGSSLPLDRERPALGGPEDGQRGQAEKHDRFGGGCQPDGHPNIRQQGTRLGTPAEKAKELLAVPDHSRLKANATRSSWRCSSPAPCAATSWRTCL